VDSRAPTIGIELPEVQYEFEGIVADREMVGVPSLNLVGILARSKPRRFVLGH
jgi:hypothetical protein